MTLQEYELLLYPAPPAYLRELKRGDLFRFKNPLLNTNTVYRVFDKVYFEANKFKFSIDLFKDEIVQLM
jgi:hypothetical protein